MNTEKLFLICGKAGVGKDLIVKKLCKQLELEFAISFTTRKPRKNEKNMIDYEFITLEDFKHKYNNGEIAEHVHYEVINDEGNSDVWYYGLSMNQLTKGKYVIAIVNPHGKESIESIDELKDKIVSILIDADPKTRLIRYLNRDEMNESKCEEMCRRFLADQQDFKTVICDYVVDNNGDIEYSIEQIKNIIVEEIVKGCL